MQESVSRGGTRTRGSGWVGTTIIFVLPTLVLGFSLIAFPGPPDASLDGSWQIMLLYAHKAGMQFGRDVIFTWGPLGFLCNGYHLGATGAVPMLLWGTLAQFGIAALLVASLNGLALWRKVAFYLLFLALHWLFLDTAYVVLITLAVLNGMMRSRAGLASVVGWAAVVGVLAGFKFTYLLLGGFGCFMAAVYWAWHGHHARSATSIVGYVLGVLAAWTLAGQNLDNLYPYVLRGFEISSGYAGAMGVDEPWSVFLWGTGLAVICILFLRSTIRSPNRPFASCGSLFLTLVFYTCWKESYTRADYVVFGGHVFALFTFVIITAPALPSLFYPQRRLHGFELAAAYGLLAMASFDGAYFALAPIAEWQRLSGNARLLRSIRSLPGDWEQQRVAASARAALPAIARRVGRETVDVYDFNTGAAILNGLNLAPRPIFQGYAAYTPSLEGWNLRHYQAQPPKFLLWSAETMDGRYPGQDDAMLLASIPGHYVPDLSEGSYELFRNVSAIPKVFPERTLVLARTVALNEEIPLPDHRGHPIWLEYDAKADALGRLRSVLYKPAALMMVTTDDRLNSRSWRLVPRVGHAGFLLVPTLESTADAVEFLKGRARGRIQSFHFSSPPEQAEFWSHFDVRVSELTGIPLATDDPFRELVDLGIADQTPTSVLSDQPREYFAVEGRHAMLLHASGSMSMAVPKGASRWTGFFGIRDGAYSGDGHTDGVEFRVEGGWLSGRTEVLWDRYLDPAHNSEDRGIQRFDITFPSPRPSSVVLRTLPGPAGDTRWDWSYVSGTQFQKN